MRNKERLKTLLIGAMGLGLTACSSSSVGLSGTDPTDYINPYMGNISHLLVPTYPTVHLPNSMLRVYPERTDYTAERIHGLPLIVTSHRGASAFNLSPLSELTDSVPAVVDYYYDGETIKPWRYQVSLPEQDVQVDFAPSAQSAIYHLSFPEKSPELLVLHTQSGALSASGQSISGYQLIQDSTKVYIYMEADKQPSAISLRDSLGRITPAKESAQGNTLVVDYPASAKGLYLRYGVSFISVEQAKRNLLREIPVYDIDMVAKHGRNQWTKEISKIEVEGGSEDEKTVFYTSLYRTYERMINISEDGKYYSAFDGKVHEDGGTPFYTDDWIWDTYRAVHPLRLLIDEKRELHMLQSYLRMAQQTPEGWLPTFPEVTGDSHRMNGNHGIATFADAYAKGLTGFDLNEAYQAAQKTLREKSYLPWVYAPKGQLSAYMDEHGYMPALHPEENETDPLVTNGEKRQAVAVSLAAHYDYWSLSRLAKFAGDEAKVDSFLRRSYDYRSIFNYETGFFHPRDKQGKFIMPFDYELSGGQGARHYYDENNAYTYRWDVLHNPADLIYLMGGKKNFVRNLEQTFQTPLSQPKFIFYRQLPDQTGNVGQFTMANEPSLHIPYLFNYAGEPWRTQRTVRKLVDSWFRNDLMGVPGDEDGGGMSAFVVFSMMGLYPVTPGLPVYNIGTPFFEKVSMKLSNGKTFTIEAKKASPENKYIQSAKLNGKTFDRAWIKHSEVLSGGTLEFEMGNKPNKEWGTATPPPSADAIDTSKTKK